MSVYDVVMIVDAVKTEATITTKKKSNKNISRMGKLKDKKNNIYIYNNNNKNNTGISSPLPQQKDVK